MYQTVLVGQAEIKRTLGCLGVHVRIRVSIILKEGVAGMGCDLNSTGLGQGPMQAVFYYFK